MLDLADHSVFTRQHDLNIYREGICPPRKEQIANNDLICQKCATGCTTEHLRIYNKKQEYRPRQGFLVGKGCVLHL